MGRGRDRIMSDPQKAEPDEELLEFLGDIDEANEDSKEGDFSDYLANTDIEQVADKPKAPAKAGKRE
jgi:hypothetical protein